jgi:hypothetical protein
MKKLTTKQYLIGGGIIALIYILYKKQKSKNGSNIIKDAMSDSKKENDKDYSNPPKVDDVNDLLVKPINKLIINPPIKNGGDIYGLLRDDSIFDSREERNNFDVFFDDSRKEF